MRLTIVLAIAASASSAMLLRPVLAPRHSSVMMAETPAEERQRLLTELRNEKVDVARAAQEAGIRAYRARAEAEEKIKKRAPPPSSAPLSTDEARAALNAMFALSDDIAVTQEVDASEEEVRAVAAEAEAAQFTERLALIDERIAMLLGDGSAAVLAKARAESAAAAQQDAGVAGSKAKRAQAAALSKVAEGKVLSATRAQQRAKLAAAAAEAAALAAQAAVGQLETALTNVEAVSYGFRQAQDEKARKRLKSMYGDYDPGWFSLGAGLFGVLGGADDGENGLSEPEDVLDANVELQRSADETRAQFDADLASLQQEQAALLEELEKKWVDGDDGRFLPFLSVFASKAAVEQQARRAALLEAATALGLANPDRATEEEVERAEVAKAARDAEEVRLVALAAAKLAAAGDTSIWDVDETAVGADSRGGSAAEEAMVESVDAWQSEKAASATAAVAAAIDATRAYDEAVAAVSRAAASGAAEADVLELELATRSLKADMAAADAAAATAREQLLLAVREEQAGRSQAATIAVTAAKAAKNGAREAEQEASAAVGEAAQALRDAEAAGRAAEEAERA